MNRLTDDKTAEKLREVSDKLKAGGFEVDVSNERYIKLAEYEQTGLTAQDFIEFRDTAFRKLSEFEQRLAEYEAISDDPKKIRSDMQILCNRIAHLEKLLEGSNEV